MDSGLCFIYIQSSALLIIFPSYILPISHYIHWVMYLFFLVVTTIYNLSFSKCLSNLIYDSTTQTLNYDHRIPYAFIVVDVCESLLNPKIKCTIYILTYHAWCLCVLPIPSKFNWFWVTSAVWFYELFIWTFQ